MALGFREVKKSTEIGLGLGLIAAIVVLALVAFGSYKQSFTDTIDVTLHAGRAGLMLEKGSDVKVAGVVIGTVSGVKATESGADLTLRIESKHRKALPSDVTATIDPTTLFGRKFVTLTAPAGSTPTTLRSGSVINGADTTTEVNDLLEELVSVIRVVKPREVSDTLSALSSALRGIGPDVGKLVTSLDKYLTSFNPYLDRVRTDIRSGSAAAQTLSNSSPDLLKTVDRLSTTSATLTDKQSQFGAFLLSFTNFGTSGEQLFRAAGAPLEKSMDALVPTASLLSEFSPVLPCFLKNLAQTNKHLEITNGGSARPGLNVMATLLMGNPSYKYSENLPRTGLPNAPSCYSNVGTRHVDFPDGSNAYAPITGPEDYFGNPIADLLFGGSR